MKRASGPKVRRQFLYMFHDDLQGFFHGLPANRFPVAGKMAFFDKAINLSLFASYISFVY